MAAASGCARHAELEMLVDGEARCTADVEAHDAGRGGAMLVEVAQLE